MRPTRFQRCLLAACLVLAIAPIEDARAASPATRAAGEPIELDWETLLPARERDRFTPAPPPPVHDYLGEGSLAALQTGSYEANRELDGERVRIPGFVVPLEKSKQGLVNVFLLVPYFGACIHVPPPPPNQIVFVRMRAGAGLASIEDAMWVTGTLRISTTKSDLGSASYVLEGEKLEKYDYSAR